MITASRKKELSASMKQLIAEFEKDAETPIVENEETAMDFDLKNGENVFAKEMEEACKTASTVEKGIEDEIKDTDAGGDATVQTITEGGSDAKKDVEADSEVFPTRCNEVTDVVQKVAPIKSKIAKLVEYVDIVAAELEENGDLNGAMELDNFSDKIEANYLK
jgi:hypothetical protein